MKLHYQMEWKISKKKIHSNISMVELELLRQQFERKVTMDHPYYTTEHQKGRHLLSEERHEIEVRLKDGWSIYRIAKHLGRLYNTIMNEIVCGTVSLYNGKVQRYKADEGKKVYLKRRPNCRKQYRCLSTIRFLQYVVAHFPWG